MIQSDYNHDAEALTLTTTPPMSSRGSEREGWHAQHTRTNPHSSNSSRHARARTHTNAQSGTQFAVSQNGLSRSRTALEHDCSPSGKQFSANHDYAQARTLGGREANLQAFSAAAQTESFDAAAVKAPMPGVCVCVCMRLHAHMRVRVSACRLWLCWPLLRLYLSM